MEFLNELEKQVTGRKNKFDELSKNIRRCEALLKSGGYPPYILDFEEGSLHWDGRLRYKGKELFRPLIECPLSIRLMMEEKLEIFINKIMKKA